MARSFGETIREMREAQTMGLRVAANQLGISPASPIVDPQDRRSIQAPMCAPRSAGHTVFLRCTPA